MNVSLRAWIAASAVLLAGTVRADAPHPLEEDLGGPASRYAEALLALARSGGTFVADPSDPERLRLTCVRTPGDPRYIGIVQRMEVAAPLAAVAAVVEDVAHYRDLFPGLVDARVVPGSRDGNRYVLATEQRVPVFFIPNVRYEQTYLVAQTSADRVVYRYRLARSRDLTNSDGLIVLERAGPDRTRFTEYDFFNARWGLLPEGAVWRESLRGTYASDVAIKLRAEHPAWSFAQISHEAERLRGEAEPDLERCRRERSPAAAVLGAALAEASPGQASPGERPRP
jgi:hypothetical protein